MYIYPGESKRQIWFVCMHAKENVEAFLELQVPTYLASDSLIYLELRACFKTQKIKIKYNISYN